MLVRRFMPWPDRKIMATSFGVVHRVFDPIQPLEDVSCVACFFLRALVSRVGHDPAIQTPPPCCLGHADEVVRILGGEADLGQPLALYW